MDGIPLHTIDDNRSAMRPGHQVDGNDQRHGIKGFGVLVQDGCQIKTIFIQVVNINLVRLEIIFYKIEYRFNFTFIRPGIAII